MDNLLTIQAKLKAPKGQYNSFGKYSYRSCEDILEAVKPLLAETGSTLTISDELQNIGERYYVKATVTLSGKDGSQRQVTAFAREDESRKGMDGSQITGAASSYARKYALNGLFLIDDTKDSDATNEHGKGQSEPPKTDNPPKTDAPEPITEAQSKTIGKLAEETGLDATAYIKANYTLVKGQKLTKQQAKEVIVYLNSLKADIAGGAQ